VDIWRGPSPPPLVVGGAMSAAGGALLGAGGALLGAGGALPGAAVDWRQSSSSDSESESLREVSSHFSHFGSLEGGGEVAIVV